LYDVFVTQYKAGDDVLRLIGVNKDSLTAGPGKRLELFTKGCIRGVLSPCEGCFNESTWTFEGLSREVTVDECVDMIQRDAWNRQVTFCGGEPILQAKAITQIAKKLKSIDTDFHIILYTAYKMDTLMKYGLRFTWIPRYGEAMRDHLMDYAHAYEEKGDRIQFVILTPDDVRELMKYVDWIIDGDYRQEQRMTTHETMHEGWFIGSSNQRIILCEYTLQHGSLLYITPEEYQNMQKIYKQCLGCGHLIPEYFDMFCKKTCEHRFVSRYGTIEKSL
jgi:organic radical activating enzyme